KIFISFDIQNGKIKILNNGPCISLKEVKNINGVKMYAPQMIASEFHSGDNLDENIERITGGTNGLGLKLTNAFSKYLILETYSKKKQWFYSQKFEEGLEKINPPIIEKNCSRFEEDFTCIEFLPDYKNLGYTSGYNKSIGKNLLKLIEARAYQAKAYVNENCNIKFNNEDISFGEKSSLSDFAQLFPIKGEVISMKMESNGTEKQDKYPLEVCLSVSDGKFEQMSLINGIWVFDGGSHIKHIQKKILEVLEPKALKEVKKSKVKFNKNYITNSLFIFVKASIVNPQFTGQVKECLGDPIEKYKNFDFKKVYYNKMWDLLKPTILSYFMDKYTPKVKKSTVRGEVLIDKCIDAKKAGHKTLWKKTSLFVCEGDSAQGTVNTGITSSKTKLNYDFYGSFSIQGVTVNARKQCTEMKSKDGKSVIIQSTKLQESARYNNLMKILGLDYGKKYELTPEGEEEFNTLRYGRIIVATDQDIDGKGNIFGLILNFITLFWPALIQRGYLTRFNTPIMRALVRKGAPTRFKNKNKQFYNIYEYEDWLRDEFGGNSYEVSKYYTIDYFKGLGTHTRAQAESMFKNYEDNLYVYQLDDDAFKNLEIYYGKETADRKVVLRTPVIHQKIKGNIVTVSVVLNTDVKEYQRDNIIRSLPNLLDGLVPARRKLLYGGILSFGQNNKKENVATFVSDVKKRTQYHHGDASLIGTMVQMAQNFPGSNNLPYFMDIGQFGDRTGVVPASARYISTKLNKDLVDVMFPQDDLYLLPYVFEDGKRCEPEYFAPILPVAIMESVKNLGTGWNCNTWARDYKEVIKNVRDMIKGNIKNAREMNIWKKDYKGEIIELEGKLYSLGSYHYDKKNNILQITELPLGERSGHFAEKLCMMKKGDKVLLKPEFREKYQDNSNNEKVDINLYLAPDIFQNIISNSKYDSEFGSIIDYFKLKKPLSQNLNLIDENFEVIEFDNYSQILNKWFHVRKKYYEARIDRQIIILEALIKY
ncbi:MAG: Kaumoebavirus, partial [Bacteroidota bacterium]